VTFRPQPRKKRKEMSTKGGGDSLRKQACFETKLRDPDTGSLAIRGKRFRRGKVYSLFVSIGPGRETLAITTKVRAQKQHQFSFTGGGRAGGNREREREQRCWGRERSRVRGGENSALVVPAPVCIGDLLNQLAWGEKKKAVVSRQQYVVRQKGK